MVRAIEDLGFDSIWVGEHLLYRWPDRPAARPVGGVDAAGGDRRRARPGSSSGRSSPARTSTTRRCSPSRRRRSTRSAAAASSWASGAGWNETEFRAFGFPFDHRIDRFEEAFTIIRTLLRDGAIDFDGRFYQARDCELLPRGPRPGGPPLMIGSNGPRMLRDHRAARRRLERLVHRHGQPPGRRRAAARARRRGVPWPSAAIPATVERTVAVLVRLPGGTGPHRRVRAAPPTIPALAGSAERDRRRRCAPTPREGIAHVQLVLDPITDRVASGRSRRSSRSSTGARPRTAGLGAAVDRPSRPCRSVLLSGSSCEAAC